MASLEAGYKCDGTKRISINEGEYSSSEGDAAISVYSYFRPNEDDRASRSSLSPAGRLSTGSHTSGGRLSGGSTSNHSNLHVFISDGVHTFYQSIAKSDIKQLPEQEGKELETVSAILRRPDDDIFKVSYKRQRGQVLGGTNDHKHTSSIKVSIRKTCLNNVVRPVWEGQMNNIRHAYYDDLPLFARNALPETSQSDASSGLASPLMLGDTINKLHKEIDALRNQNKQLEANTLRWKSTSEKLSNQWEDEKSELTARFLTLFNEHKLRHIETVKELEQLKGKKQKIGDATTAKRGARKSLDPMYQDIDDQDFQTYDQDEISRLARGPAHVRKSAPSGKMVAASSLTQDTAGYINPHTGAREYSNIQEMFSGSSDSEDDKMKE